VEQKITEYVQSMLTDKSIKIEPTSTLITNGLIDSLSLIDLISALEKEFSISFSNDEMIPDNFDSISAISHLVQSKKGHS
jgi:acyl carrier protein